MSENRQKAGSNFSINSDQFDWNSEQGKLKCDKTISKQLEKNGINIKFFYHQTEKFLEIVMLQQKVVKINRKSKKQKRILLITNKHVFNVKPCGSLNSMLSRIFSSLKIKRKIPLKSIEAVTVSRFGSEFVLHVPNQYDYHYASDERPQILYVLTDMFTTLTGKQGLTYFFKDDLALKDVVTTRTDAKKKIQRLPSIAQKDLAPIKYFILNKEDIINLYCTQNEQIICESPEEEMNASFDDSFEKTKNKEAIIIKQCEYEEEEGGDETKKDVVEEKNEEILQEKKEEKAEEIVVLKAEETNYTEGKLEKTDQKQENLLKFNNEEVQKERIIQEDEKIEIKETPIEETKAEEKEVKQEEVKQIENKNEKENIQTPVKQNQQESNSATPSSASPDKSQNSPTPLNLQNAIKQVGLQNENGIKDILGDTLFIKKSRKFDNSKLETFEIKKLLGRGAFGKVMLVQHRVSKKMYAMKSIRKDIVIAQEQLENVKQERGILEKIDHPFLVGMEYAFQTSEKLYFILAYKPGGEMFFHLKNVRRFPESRAKFYAAELIIALEYLHSKRIAFRDLKPENILLDLTGHIALTDFGIAKELPEGEDKVYDILGTPEYVAPEVLSDDSETTGFNAFLLDWWALGCLVFEMLVGLPPFLHKHQEKLFKLIQTQPQNYPDLVTISPKGKAFIDALLEKDPLKRLGAKGPEEVLKHPWFLTINWTSLRERKVRPPFIPQLSKDDADLKYVDEEFKNQEIINSVMPDEMHEIVEKNQDQFEDFEFEQKEEEQEELKEEEEKQI